MVFGIFVGGRQEKAWVIYKMFATGNSKQELCYL